MKSNVYSKIRDYYENNKKLLLRILIVVIIASQIHLYWPKTLFKIYDTALRPDTTPEAGSRMTIAYNNGNGYDTIEITDNEKIKDLLLTLNRQKYIPSMQVFRKTAMKFKDSEKTYTVDLQVAGNYTMGIVLNEDYLYIDKTRYNVDGPSLYKTMGSDMDLEFLNKLLN